MSWRNIRLILLREIRDQLRDRRTLFMIAILPLLMYPALAFGLVQMTVLFTEQPRRVVILGAGYLPPPQLVKDDRFLPAWFNHPSEAEKLEVITDLPTDGNGNDERRQQILGLARQVQSQIAERQSLEDQHRQAVNAGDEQRAANLSKRLQQVNQHLTLLFAGSAMEVLILVPEGLAGHVATVNRRLAQRDWREEEHIDYPRPLIIRNGADEKSLIAYNRVREAMEKWEEQILQQRWQEARLPASLSTPVNPARVDLALDTQRAANIWSKLFPALLVIMAVTGAFYPAVDVGAGEKERGTMETLLICPATRPEIVMGKFLTVMSFSVATAVLNLMSMGLTGRYLASLTGGGAFGELGDLSFPSPMALVWLVVLLIPLAALFSALCLALATFARSTKEGQYYLTPLLLTALGITVFCLSPAVEITPFYSVMPVMNIALLLKALLLSPTAGGGLYLYMLPVLLTSIGYSLLALWWAIEQFKREDVLFREAERLDLGLWFRHLLRDKEPTPSFAEAGVCFVMIVLLQFLALKPMGVAMETAGSERVLQLLMIQLLVIIATPAMFMGVMLTTSVRSTFRLNLPPLKFLGAAALLPLALQPLSSELLARLRWFFPQLPSGISRVLESITDPSLPWWLVLLAFAVTPAVCEEIAFRGFLLSGFSRSRRKWLPIVLSSIAFGIIHMVPQQVFNAALLGLVLGLLVVRSNSLFPAILFHFIYNSLEVIRGRYIGTTIEIDALPWIFRSGINGDPRYSWRLLCICAIVAIVLLHWLVRQPTDGEAEEPDLPPPEPATTPADGKAAIRAR